MLDISPIKISADLTPLVKAIAKSVSNLTDKPSEALGNLIACKINSYNVENVNTVLDKTDSAGQKDNLRSRPIKLKTIEEMIDAVSGLDPQEDEEILDLWAQLLVTCTQTQDAEHPRFRIIIKSISPDEARIIKSFGERTYLPTINLLSEISEETSAPHSISECNFSRLDELITLQKPASSRFYLSNLISLGVLEKSPIGFGGTHIESNADKQYDAIVNREDYAKTREYIDKNSRKNTKMFLEKTYLRLSEVGMQFLLSVKMSTAYDPVTRVFNEHV